MRAAAIQELIGLAQTLGNHASQVTLWKEGACAVKLSNNRFAVTGCEAQLAQLREEEVLEYNLQTIQQLSENEATTDEDILEAFGGESAPSPSRDTLVMAYFLGLDGVRFVAHTQPVEINQSLSSPRARQFADRRISPSEILACGAASLLVPYVDPGLNLAREVRRKMVLWRDRYKVPPKIALIQNHGMFVLAASVEEVVQTIEMAIKSAKIFTGAATLGGPVFLTPNNVMHIESLRGT